MLSENNVAEMQQEIRAANTCQNEQDAVDCKVTIKSIERITGNTLWLSAFSETVALLDDSVTEKYFGSKVVKTIDYFRVNADLNKNSFEREALSDLISLGYRLEELEVQYSSGPQKQWGTCVWYSDHSSYHEQSLADEHPTATVEDFRVGMAMFKTENAGDQMESLLSAQMMAEALYAEEIFGRKPQFLFDKKLVFLKVVLSLPSGNEQKIA